MRKVMADLKADVESGDMSLEERLEDMNIDSAEYKAYAQRIRILDSGRH